MTEPGNDKMPLVSVVVITRNRAGSLARTLRAIAELDYPKYEIVVVDNASTDETPKVVEAAGARYFRTPADCGISGTRQRGLDEARGEIVAMCDDDCVPRPDWIAVIAERFLAEPSLALLGGHVINIGFPDSRQYKGSTRLGRNAVLFFVEDPHRAEFYGNLNLSVRRSTMAAVGGYDPFYKAGLEEIDLALTVKAHGFDAAYEPAAIVEHYFTGINYKRGRVFFDKHMMRLYLLFKHRRPVTAADWGRFAIEESKICANELYRAARALGATLIRARIGRLPAVLLDTFNLVTARLSIPWVLWRTRGSRRRGLPEARSYEAT